MNSKLKIIIKNPNKLHDKGKSINYLNWYKINEIHSKDFLECIKPIYDVIESKKICKGVDDIFLKKITLSRYGWDEKHWETHERIIRLRKVLTMKIGFFHENLMSKFKGYEKTKKYGVDFKKKDDTEYWEIKNRDNTLNYNSAQTVAQNFKNALKEEGNTKCYLVYINCSKSSLPKYQIPHEVNILTGEQAYHQLSGRDNFYNDLLDTIDYVFHNFKNYDQAVKNLLI